MRYNKYPTSFRTYDEFEEIFESIPIEYRLEWAGNLSPKLLLIENEDGWTIASRTRWQGVYRKILKKEWLVLVHHGMTSTLSGLFKTIRMVFDERMAETRQLPRIMDGRS